MFHLPLWVGLFGDKHSLQAERRLSLCLSQLSFSQENISILRADEEMFQFKLPAANTIGIPAGHPQSFHQVRPSRPCCHIRLHTGQRF
jgi:hypothetical protein